MEFPPQTDPVCCRCGCPLPDNFIPITGEDGQVKAVCASCATKAEKQAANPQREESR
jgi:hypothetical protein